MYMLWGGGGERIVCLKPWVRTLSDESKPSLMSAPFRVRADGDLDDRSGKRVSLLGDVRRVLYELKTETEWEGVVVAVASCTDEPAWARECMRKFEVPPSTLSPPAVCQLHIHRVPLRRAGGPCRQWHVPR